MAQEEYLDFCKASVSFLRFILSSGLKNLDLKDIFWRMIIFTVLTQNNIFYFVKLSVLSCVLWETNGKNCT